MKIAAKEKRILLSLRIMIILCAISVLMCAGCLIAHGILKSNAYQTYVGVSSATEKEQRMEAYKAALRLDPGKPDAYLRILDVYSEDGIFEKKESGEFLSIYNANRTKLNYRDSQYPQLLKKIGFLYINGYNEATTTCIRMAMPFLTEAYTVLADTDAEKQTVDCYCKIGSYYEEYIWNATAVKEITPQIVETLISDIEGTLSNFHQNTDTGSVFDYLGFSVAVCNLLYDQRDILAVTIPGDRINGILDSIYENLPEMNTLQKERTKQLLQTLTENKNTYYDMIERAYARQEVS